MIIPKNGRVIILDDKIEQALPLIKVLSKNKIAFTYYSEEIEYLPNENNPHDDVRLIFLDINLSDGGAPEESIKSQLKNTLQRIIKSGTPYIAAIWSLKENEYENLLQDLFDNLIPGLKPLRIINLTKSDYFDLDLVDDGNEGQKAEYNASEGFLEKLTNKITDSLNSIDALEALLKWEELVDKSSALVVNEIFNLAQKNGNLNNDLKQVYYNLAYGYWGKTLKRKNPDEIIIKSLYGLNSILMDKIEYLLLKQLKVELIQDFPQGPDFVSKIRAELNTRLLFTEDIFEEPLPGNLYKSDNDVYKKNIVESILDRNTFCIDYCTENDIDEKDFYEGLNIKQEYKRPSIKYCYNKEREAIEEAVYFEIELTPICDYSQDNMKFCRMVSGVILDEKYRTKVKRNADFFYTSPLFMLDGKNVYFYCDLRYVQSKLIPDLNGIKPMLRVRHLFQADIQSHLARQVSRPGIVSI